MPTMRGKGRGGGRVTNSISLCNCFLLFCCVPIVFAHVLHVWKSGQKQKKRTSVVSFVCQLLSSPPPPPPPPRLPSPYPSPPPFPPPSLAASLHEIKNKNEDRITIDPIRINSYQFVSIRINSYQFVSILKSMRKTKKT